MGIRHGAPLLLLSPPNPLRWASAGTPCVFTPHRLVPSYSFGAAGIGRAGETPAPTERLPILCVGADVPSARDDGPTAPICPEQLPISPGCAMGGGVISAHRFTKFCIFRAQWPGGKRGMPLRFCPPDETASSTVGYPRKTGGLGPTPPVRGRWPEGPEGVGKAACEHPLRVGAHRSRPPVTLWFLSDRSERDIVPLPLPRAEYS